ncbi:MAG: hypothetical protein EB116_18110 [Betaproteobacteria bacterium]|nr:hypothetical protein [Betaproteobacteria bacterium]
MLVIAVSLAPWLTQSHAAKLRDISAISGVRSNQLIGYGLVVGLDGSGDQTTQTPFTIQTTISLLQALGVTLPPGQRMQLRNTAAVMVTASLPSFARPGQAQQKALRLDSVKR